MADPTRSQYESLPGGGSDLWDLENAGPLISADFFPVTESLGTLHITADAITTDLKANGVNLYFHLSAEIRQHVPPEGTAEGTLRLIDGVVKVVNVI